MKVWQRRMRVFRLDNITSSQISYWTWSSPVGELLLLADARGLRWLNFQNGPHPVEPNSAWKKQGGPFKNVIQQLEGYFAGKLRTFQVELSLQGTPFQLAVWGALQGIPYGATASYADIAQKIGHFKACRAVGGANGQNPISIIVPCHRVIGKSGHLVGYGGGLPIKEALLDLERHEMRKDNTASRPLGG